MEINDIIAIAERIDPGARSFKSDSTRESRNEKWAFIIGCVHHGHPLYNRTPDARWCIKSGGNGRPQSDDVVVNNTNRDYYDCIPNAGIDSAYFEAHYGGTLPSDQPVYAPPVPNGGGNIPNPIPTPTPPVDNDILSKLEDIEEAINRGFGATLLKQDQQIDAANRVADLMMIQIDLLKQLVLQAENASNQRNMMMERMNEPFNVKVRF